MVLINRTWKRSEKYGKTYKFMSLNTMLIGFKIFKSAIGKVPILELMIFPSNSNKIQFDSFKKMVFCLVGKFIQGG